MKSLAFKRAHLLVVAIALIMADASILCGQLDSDEMVFEQPLTNVKPQIPAYPLHTIRNGAPAGKAMVNQANAIKPATVQRNVIPGTEPKRIVPYSQAAAAESMTPKAASNNSNVKMAAYQDSTKILTPDGQDRTLMERRPKGPTPIPQVNMTRPNQGNPPQVTGSMMGLRAGETNIERMVQMQTLQADMEREINELRQQNAGLLAANKETKDQLMAAARAIQSARRELVAAKSVLDRLRTDIHALREKVRVAEKEHASLLQSMGPLLQQLLESNDVSALPPNPPE